MEAFEILTGVGRLYIAPVGTAFPALGSVPGVGWVDLGETKDGVTLTKTQKIDQHRTDQRTGPVKASRSEEELIVATALAAATAENMGVYLGGTVSDTPAGAGTIGTRSVGLYQGPVVKEYALLFRGSSPYGATMPAQFQVPRGYIDGDMEIEFKVDDFARIPIEFHALEDLDAAQDDARFGSFIAQDAAAI